MNKGTGVSPSAYSLLVIVWLFETRNSMGRDVEYPPIKYTIKIMFWNENLLFDSIIMILKSIPLGFSSDSSSVVNMANLRRKYTA